MNIIPPAALEFSAWSLLAIPAAVLAGLFVTLMSCLRFGLVHGGLVQIMTREWRAFMALASVDGLGAVFALVSLWLVSPGRSSVVSVADSHPYVFWPLVGALGPVAGAGLLGLVPHGLMFKARTSKAAGRSERVAIRDLRKYFVIHLQSVLDQREKTWHQTRRRWLLKLAREVFADQSFSVDVDFCDVIEHAAEAEPKRGKRRLPKTWTKIRRDWDQTPSSEREDSPLPGAMASAAITAGFTYEVAAACGILISDFDFKLNYTPQKGSVLELGAHSVAFEAAQSDLDIELEHLSDEVEDH